MANQKCCNLELKMLIEKLKPLICSLTNKEWLAQNSTQQSWTCSQYSFIALNLTHVSLRVEQFNLLEKKDKQILCKYVLTPLRRLLIQKWYLIFYSEAIHELFRATLIVSNLDGFNLANDGQFAKFTKLFLPPQFSTL